MVLMYGIINQYDTKTLNLEALPEMVITQIATLKLSLSFKNNSLLLLGLRLLINIHEKRVVLVKGPHRNDDIQTSINLS